MKLPNFLKLSAFFVMIVYALLIVTTSISEVFHLPYCQTFTYNSSQNVTKIGQNSFTASQIKNCLMQNGFENIKRLRLDDEGIWRALVKFKKSHFFVSVDYSGTVSIQNERKKYD
ncbi:hypothetical protein [Bartonella krasnovii]|uniref:hypothetical protein n=1 Tax=Bartonella krasnovii TaxID=2267275 RepID=UPI001F4CF065|nr:hypothetical protein [Bartonella krasnovii]UNF39576.1 hypothetical protein MNL10_03955 [Bartonella krasnovii]UNF41334.1 hypothetical protein MNL09_04385 [Bartonella krasnovii]UNF44621.1 hypothetical protein MNL07_03855 [Bartonella krasnovii]UNF46149.1 hypothetical protein MNL06_03435 [Bartonella krasnovii]UNF51120.1 hypothetical protein MNL03_03955 [Bartonella krasnovii]